MGGFVVEDGESILFRERVDNVRDRHAACELIVTDRRVVLTSFDTKAATRGLMIFGALGGLLGGLLSGATKQLTHQIRRDRFGSVEVTGKRDLRIDSAGEGYGKTFFEISIKQPQQLADRIHRWAAGQLDAAELPTMVVRPRE